MKMSQNNCAHNLYNRHVCFSFYTSHLAYTQTRLAHPLSVKMKYDSKDSYYQIPLTPVSGINHQKY